MPGMLLTMITWNKRIKLMCIQTKRLLYKLKMGCSPHQPIRRARCCPRRRNRTAPVLYGSRWSFAARWNLKTHWLCWQEEGQRVAGWVRRHWPRRWPSTDCCWKRKPKGSWRGKESPNELYNHFNYYKKENYTLIKMSYFPNCFWRSTMYW